MGLLLGMTYSQCKLEVMGLLVVCSINQHAEAPGCTRCCAFLWEKEVPFPDDFQGGKHGTKTGAK